MKEDVTVIELVDGSVGVFDRENRSLYLLDDSKACPREDVLAYAKSAVQSGRGLFLDEARLQAIGDATRQAAFLGPRQVS